MLKILKLLGKALLVLAIFTCVGQIPVKGVSLERRYHVAVNAPGFQKVFWTAALPITWTGQKVQELFDEREALRNGQEQLSDLRQKAAR